MAKQPYLPSNDDDKVTWVQNFANKKSQHAATFGFTPGSVTQTNEDAAMFAYILMVLDMIRTDSKEFTSFKDSLRDGPHPGQ